MSGSSSKPPCEVEPLRRVTSAGAVGAAMTSQTAAFAGRWVRFGFLAKNDPQLAVDYGAAHGAFASTTPGDTSMATQQEVEKLMQGGGARVVR